MEDTLRGKNVTVLKNIASLNPCFNGRYSQSIVRYLCGERSYSLNPCFNGRYSQRCKDVTTYYKRLRCVLILVLMEDTLRANKTTVPYAKPFRS